MPREIPEADPATVATIVDIATAKCFDWGQGAIAETMAAVAAELTKTAVIISRETTEENYK